MPTPKKPKPSPGPTPRTQPPTHKIYPTGKKPTVITSSNTMPSETQLRKDWNESAGGRRAGISYTDFMLAERKRRGYRNQMDK
jgi:hypothetical protein